MDCRAPEPPDQGTDCSPTFRQPRRVIVVSIISWSAVSGVLTANDTTNSFSREHHHDIRKTSDIASAGRETAGREVSAGRIETSGRSGCGLVTRDYGTLIPWDARTNHQEGTINDGPALR